MGRAWHKERRSGDEPNGKVGDAGKDGAIGRRGPDGDNSAGSIVLHGNYCQLASLASSIQIGMVVHSAELDYLGQNFKGATEKLAWVCRMADPNGMCPPIPVVPIFKVDAPVLERRVDEDLLKTVRVRALLLVQQLESGLDYFGFPPNYVELVDKQFYKDYLKQLSEIAQNVERRQEEFWRAIRANQDARTALDDAAKHLSVARQQLEIESQALQRKFDPLQREIQEISNRIADLDVEVNRADAAFKAAVERQGAGCRFADVLKVVSTIVAVVGAVYTGGASLATLAAASSAFVTALNMPPDEVKKLQGEALKKFENDKNFISFAQKVGGTAQAVGEGYERIKGLLKDNDDNRAKLILSKDEYAKTLQPFLNLPEAEKLKSLLDAFFGAIETKNAKCVEYTAGRIKEEIVHSEMEQLQLELNRIALGISRNRNDELYECGTHLDSALAKIKLSIVRGLFFAKRSLELFSLRPIKLDFNDKTIADLDSLRAQWLAEEAQAITERGRAEQQFKESVPVEFSVKSSPQVIALLKQHGVTTVAIPIDHPAFKSNMRAIRVSEVKVWIDGIKTSDNVVTLKITKWGDSKFRAVDGRVMEFAHRPRQMIWQYSSKTRKGTVTDSLGGKEGTYVDVSPFGTWTLEVPAEDNRGLSLKNVTGIALHFLGSFLSSSA